MSEVTQVPLQPLKRGSLSKLWFGILLLAAAALALAWVGAGSMRGETTATGISFRTVEEGNGALIQDQDVAMVDYVGTLDDGTVFDSSQGQPRPFTPMAVVPGFAEAMRKMQKDGVYKFRLPPGMGYPAGSGSELAGKALNFDVRVVSVMPGMGPLLIQQAQQQQAQQQPGL